MDTNVVIENVRLSFPSLWREKKFAPTDAKGSYSATFLLDKKANATAIAEVRRVIDMIVKENFKGKRPPHVCLREGREKPDTVGYGEDVMFINTRSDKPPSVVDRDLSTLKDGSSRPYAGCYVNAMIQIWAQDNQYGKRINAKLRSVQFVKDGKAFGEGEVDVTKVFRPISDEDESPL